jgi:hypothetical protein
MTRPSTSFPPSERKTWITGTSPVMTTDGQTQTLPATASRPGDAKSIRPRGRGECRAPNAPAALRAKGRKHASKSPRSRQITRHSRTRMVLTAYGARPRRSLARCVASSRHVMPASRHQDHTLSPSANTRRRLSAWLTSTASQPNVS